MNPLISVIVPAFNAEKTILRCVNSIIKQTYRNLEIIVVNDGSTDNTSLVLEKIKETDNRIRIISITNSGVSYARNIGIDNATGEYITFVDSDDFIDSDMYSELIKLIREFNVKIAHCSYKNVDIKGEVISVVGGNNRIVKQTHDEAMECLLTGRLFNCGLWNKLYDISLFKECRLDESISIYEDLLLNVYLFDRADITIYYDIPYYNYVKNENSSTHISSQIFKGEQGLYVSRKIYDFSLGQTFEKNAEEKLANSILELYRVYTASYNKNNKEKMSRLLGEIVIYKNRGFYSSRKKALLYYLCRYCPCIYAFLYFFYDKIRVKKLDPIQ